MSRSKSIVVCIFSAILLFLFTFQPFVLGVNTLYLADIVIIVLYVVSHQKIRRFDKTGGNSFLVFKAFAPFLAYFAVYFIAFVLLDRNYPESHIPLLKTVVMWAIQIMVILMFWSILTKAYSFRMDTISRIIVSVLLIQLAFVVLSFLVPSFRQFVNDSIVSSNGSSSVADSITRVDTKRGYGFANTLFDAFTYVVALLIVFSFAYSIEKNSMPIMLLSICSIFICLVNGRSGVVLAVIGIALVFITNLKRIFCSSRLFKIIFLFVAVMMTGTLALSALPNSTREWLDEGVDSIVTLLFKDQKTGVFSVLLNAELPSNLVFGACAEPQFVGHEYIDNGYVRSVWMFGLLGVLLLFAGYFYLYWVALRKSANCLLWKTLFASAVIFAIYTLKIVPYFNIGANIYIFGLPYLSLSYPKTPCFPRRSTPKKKESFVLMKGSPRFGVKP